MITFLDCCISVLILSCAVTLVKGLSSVLQTSGRKDKRMAYREKSAVGPPYMEMGETPLSVHSGHDNCQLYREMYFKLHNLEDHPDVIRSAERLLISLLSESLASAVLEKSAILSIEHFSPNALHTFVKQQLDATTVKWQQYLDRRRSGQPRELLQNLDKAKDWLVQNAPVKFIDGAWLSNIHKVTTPFVYRSVTKDAWQVLSEEMGDGDLEKNHVYVYQQLLRKVGRDLPPADSIQFTNEVSTDNLDIWKAAIAQLIVSLLPHEFLPEILGFNMHFEMLTFETMVAAKELRELNMDPYYFNLHITIDNAHSGHIAMASETVTKYIEAVKEVEGDVAAHEAWKRVQAGYLLSASGQSLARSDVPKIPTPPIPVELARIFQLKTVVAHRLHDNCRATIGGKSLSTWLEPGRFNDASWQRDFFHALSNTKPWVYKGESNRSRLVQSLSWGGQMFGAFTHNELAILKSWIDSLFPHGSEFYWHFTGRGKNDTGEVVARHNRHINYPVYIDTPGILPVMHGLNTPSAQFTVDNSSGPEMDKLLPLWFAHPCLLESMIRCPWEATSEMGCAVIRILRAQYGFGPELPGVTGMDEVRRIDYLDLIDIGLDLVRQVGYSAPRTLAEALDRWPSEFAGTMLALSMRPQKNVGLLFGLVQAFVHLHSWCAASTLLSPKAKKALYCIAEREQASLDVCISELENRGGNDGFMQGYEMGRIEIQRCFRIKAQL